MTARAILDRVPLLGRWLRRRASLRSEVRRRAAALVAHEGGASYYRARDRARELRVRGDRHGHRVWTLVAIEIARRTGKVIGEKARDRWGEPPR